MTRPSKDRYFMDIAKVVATRATCARRSVGCVLVDVRGHILATGYNGKPRGFPHCHDDLPCAGAQAASGTALSACEAVHAEQNALLQCPDVNRIFAAYVTVSPCVTCTKLLLNTSCARIYFAEPYAHDAEAKRLWQACGPEGAVRQWVHFEDCADD